MANALTSLRILCGLLLLFFPAFSPWYNTFYLLGGFTDAIDGTVARRLGTETEFGAKLDTVADFVFLSAVIIKLIGALWIPVWLLAWIGIITAIKLSGVILGAIKRRRLVSVHSTINKVCGIATFIVLFFIGWDFPWQAKAVLTIAVCVMATIAAIHEWHIIYSGKAS